MCTLITSKGTDIDENIANQNHATRTPKPGYLNLSIRARNEPSYWALTSTLQSCVDISEWY